MGSTPVLSRWGDAEARLELLRLRRALATTVQPKSAHKKTEEGFRGAHAQGKEEGSQGDGWEPLRSPE